MAIVAMALGKADIKLVQISESSNPFDSSFHPTEQETVDANSGQKTDHIPTSTDAPPSVFVSYFCLL
jgi:hypothetical protein